MLVDLVCAFDGVDAESVRIDGSRRLCVAPVDPVYSRD